MSETLHLAERTEQINNRLVICLIDGEHYPPVTKSALRELQNTGADIVGLIFLGGTEKVENPMEELASEDDSYQIYSGDDSIETVLQNIHRAAEELTPDIAIDLSDEPVVDYRERFRIISHLLIEEIEYLNADTTFSPPTFEDVLEKPSLGIIGTGKRVGKTAVSVSVSRYLKEQGGDPGCHGYGQRRTGRTGSDHA